MMKSNLLFPLVVLLVAFSRLAFDYLNQIDIHYEEAQYWVWSQNLSLSYLTKGPFLAWALSLSNYIFGNTYIALKIFSYLALFTTAALLLFTVSEISGKKPKPFYFLIICLSPALFFLGGLATTDIFLFLFWSLALFAYTKFLNTRNDNWFLLIGLAVGVGLLIKASILLLPASIIFYFLISDLRKFLISPKLFLSIAIASVIFSPVLIWNYGNDWMYFSHELDHLISQSTSLNPHILFVALFLMAPSFIFFLNKKFYAFLLSKKIRPLFIPMLAMILFFLMKSIFGKVQVNWPLPVFLCLIPITILYAEKQRISLASNTVIIFIIFVLASPATYSLLDQDDPMHPMRGWKKSMEDVFTGNEYDLLVSNDYKLLSVAAYYNKAAQNLIYDRSPGYRLTHYDTWKNKINDEEKILYLTYDSKNINRLDLECAILSKSNINSRKNLILYTCKKL